MRICFAKKEIAFVLLAFVGVVIFCAVVFVSQCNRLWVETINISKKEIEQADEYATNIAIPSAKAVQFIEDNAAKRACEERKTVEVQRILRRSRFRDEAFSLLISRNENDLSMLFEPANCYLVQYGCGEERYEVSSTEKWNWYMDSDLAYQGGYYFQGVDCAKTLLWRSFGQQRFSYIVTCGTAWVIGECGGDIRGVFLGALGKRPLFGLGDSIGITPDEELEKSVESGIVYSSDDLVEMWEKWPNHFLWR